MVKCQKPTDENQVKVLIFKDIGLNFIPSYPPPPNDTFVLGNKSSASELLNIFFCKSHYGGKCTEASIYSTGSGGPSSLRNNYKCFVSELLLLSSN